MKYCKKCDIELEQEDRFCPECGGKVATGKVDKTKFSNQMQCPFCDTEIEEKTNFCPGCGNNIKDSVCPNCRYKNKSHYTYCAKCGSNLGIIDGEENEDFGQIRIKKAPKQYYFANGVLSLVLLLFVSAAMNRIMRFNWYFYTHQIVGNATITIGTIAILLLVFAMTKHYESFSYPFLLMHIVVGIIYYFYTAGKFSDMVFESTSVILLINTVLSFWTYFARRKEP